MLFPHRYIGLLCEVLEWQKSHGSSMNKENSASLAVKCESPLSPQSRRFFLKRPYYEESRIKYNGISDPHIYGNEENDDALSKRQRMPMGNRTEILFNKDHLRVIKNQYYYSPRWRQNLPFRNLADKNGNNLLMIAPALIGNRRDDSDDKSSNVSKDKRSDAK